MSYAKIPSKGYGAHDGEMQRLFKHFGFEDIDAVHFGKDDVGLDCIFYGATANVRVTWDESADTWYFGQDAYGPDVYFYGDTTSCYGIWDASEIMFKSLATFTADAQIATYDHRIESRTTYNTAITSGKIVSGIYLRVAGSGNINSGAFLWPLWIDSSGTGTNNGTYWMARFSVQSGGLAPNAYIQFQSASPGVAHLFELAGNVAPWRSGGTSCTDSGDTDPVGTVAIEDPTGTTRYIRVWAAR